MAENISISLSHSKVGRKLFDSPEIVNTNNKQTREIYLSSSDDDDIIFSEYLSKLRNKSPDLKESPSVIVVSDSSDIEYETNIESSVTKHVVKTQLGTGTNKEHIDTIQLDSPMKSLEESLHSLEINDTKTTTINLKDSSDSSVDSENEIFYTPLSKPRLNPLFSTPNVNYFTPLNDTKQTQTPALIRKFNSTKIALGQNWYFIFNESVFSSLLPKELQIKWNKFLTKTAGYCEYKLQRDTSVTMRTVSINLSTKIITDEHRMKSALIHEMCHAATWIINGVKEGHGPIWKGWAQKAGQLYPSLPPITRCHSYSIDTKFKYKCVNCYYIVGRHSKSIDTSTKRCPYCKSRLELVPLTDKKGNPKKLNLFAEFVKENYNTLDRSIPHSEKMKDLSVKYKEIKLQNTPID